MTKKQSLINEIKQNCIDADDITAKAMSECAGMEVKPSYEDEALNICYRWAFEMLNVSQLEKLKDYSTILIDESIAKQVRNLENENNILQK